MVNDLWDSFGFRESPYGTRALSSEEGDQLLVGREDEVDWLTIQLTSNVRVPILTGENGVGKTSIANTVAYRLSKKHNENNSRYFVLSIDQINDMQFENLQIVEQNLCYKIIYLLLKEKKFLGQCGISFAEIIFVSLRMSIMSAIGIGPLSFDIDKSSSTGYFRQIARKWLEKCFCNPHSGGIICIIDNLENNRTSRQVQVIVENMRDTFFNMPGLRWILCGTQDVIRGTLASQRLSGYVTNYAIEPVDNNIASVLIQRRIEYFGRDNMDPPVDKKGFQFIYEKVVNRQLRVALKLCEDFAQHLYTNPSRRTENRMDELKLWLIQRASQLPNRLNRISRVAWSFFENVVDFGGEVLSTDYRFLGISSKEVLDEAVQSLTDNGFLTSVPTDDGYLLRVTEIGWLENYRQGIQ